MNAIDLDATDLAAYGSGSNVREALIEQLRERIKHLESACNLFEKGSEENCEVFDVLMAAGRISMTDADERLATVVEALVSENKLQAAQLKYLRTYATAAVDWVDQKMNAYAMLWTTAQEKFGAGSAQELLANGLLHNLRNAHMNTFGWLRKALALSAGDRRICENCCKDPCARYDRCGRQPT